MVWTLTSTPIAAVSFELLVTTHRRVEGKFLWFDVATRNCIQLGEVWKRPRTISFVVRGLVIEPGAGCSLRV